MDQHQVAVDAIEEELDWIRSLNYPLCCVMAKSVKERRFVVCGLIEMAWKLKAISDQEYKDFSARIGR